MSVNIKYEGKKNYAMPLLRIGISNIESVIDDLHRRKDIDDSQRDQSELALKSIAEVLLGDAAKIARVRSWSAITESPATESSVKT